MAKSNFDNEIKQGMKAKPADKKPKAVPAKPPVAAPVDTGAAMQAAGQAHMDAIHAHINSMKG